MFTGFWVIGSDFFFIGPEYQLGPDFIHSNTITNRVRIAVGSDISDVYRFVEIGSHSFQSDPNIISDQISFIRTR